MYDKPNHIMYSQHYHSMYVKCIYTLGIQGQALKVTHAIMNYKSMPPKVICIYFIRNYDITLVCKFVAALLPIDTTYPS